MKNDYFQRIGIIFVIIMPLLFFYSTYYSSSASIGAIIQGDGDTIPDKQFVIGHDGKILKLSIESNPFIGNFIVGINISKIDRINNQYLHVLSDEITISKSQFTKEYSLDRAVYNISVYTTSLSFVRVGVESIGTPALTYWVTGIGLAIGIGLIFGPTVIQYLKRKKNINN